MKLYAIDQHDQLLHIWRELNASNLHVVHVDFHCDMRGLLVDRKRQLGWKISEVRSTLDEGNYLRYGIFEDIVDGVTWVHGTPGGRMCDFHTLKYSTDWSTRFHRKEMDAQKPKPLRYEVSTMGEWQGTDEQVFLDIDWDTFADQSLPVTEIDSRVEEFLSKPIGPNLRGIAVCYSRHHSHDTRERYDAFVSRLAEKFGAEVEKVEYVEGSNVIPLRMKLIPPKIYSALQSIYHGFRLFLKRRGIY